jgi:hypothetical protein
MRATISDDGTFNTSANLTSDLIVGLRTPRSTKLI